MQAPPGVSGAGLNINDIETFDILKTLPPQRSTARAP